MFIFLKLLCLNFHHRHWSRILEGGGQGLLPHKSGRRLGGAIKVSVCSLLHPSRQLEPNHFLSLLEIRKEEHPGMEVTSCYLFRVLQELLCCPM